MFSFYFIMAFCTFDAVQPGTVLTLHGRWPWLTILCEISAKRQIAGYQERFKMFVFQCSANMKAKMYKGNIWKNKSTQREN
jgi:hypothetical protein